MSQRWPSSSAKTGHRSAGIGVRKRGHAHQHGPSTNAILVVEKTSPCRTLGRAHTGAAVEPSHAVIATGT